MPRTLLFMKSSSQLKSCCAAKTQDGLDEMCFSAKTTFMHRPLKPAGPKSTLGRKTTRSNESGEALQSTLSHRPSKDTKKKKSTYRSAHLRAEAEKPMRPAMKQRSTLSHQPHHLHLHCRYRYRSKTPRSSSSASGSCSRLRRCCARCRSCCCGCAGRVGWRGSRRGRRRLCGRGSLAWISGREDQYSLLGCFL